MHWAGWGTGFVTTAEAVADGVQGMHLRSVKGLVERQLNVDGLPFQGADAIRTGGEVDVACRVWGASGAGNQCML